MLSTGLLRRANNGRGVSCASASGVFRSLWISAQRSGLSTMRPSGGRRSWDLGVCRSLLTGRGQVIGRGQGEFALATSALATCFAGISIAEPSPQSSLISIYMSGHCGMAVAAVSRGCNSTPVRTRPAFCIVRGGIRLANMCLYCR